MRSGAPAVHDVSRVVMSHQMITSPLKEMRLHPQMQMWLP